MNSVSRNTLAVVLCFIIFSSPVYSQTTSIKLPAADSTGNFRVLSSTNNNLLRLNGDAGFYFGGTYGAGVVPAAGTGARLMWCPGKAAFRAGYVNSSQWNEASVGSFSIAAGNSTVASGDNSTATGYSTNASGIASTAMGGNTSATGDYSTTMGHATSAKGSHAIAEGDSSQADGNYSIAMGFAAKATGVSSVALGDHTTASGPFCTAMGYYTTANGFASTAMGDPTVANGYVATAIGHEVIADGDMSTAMGSFATTNRCKGAFIIGDASTEQITGSTNDHQMTMRFAGGYRLFSEPEGKIGVFLGPGQSQWKSESDSTKKENFVPADGEYFLKSLGQIRLGSWNYKVQDAKLFRHYGPMAQDIFHYFGKDNYGTIGCDTALGTGDMDGIMMICLQALEKRTIELKTAVSELQKANDKIAIMEKRMEKMEQIIYSRSSIK